MRQDTKLLNRELFQTCKVLPWGRGGHIWSELSITNSSYTPGT